MMHTQNVALTSEVSSAEISGDELTQCAVALQTQAFHGLSQAWHINANVHAYPDPKQVPPDSWKIVIKDQLDDPGALGYHTDENNQPVSYVMYQEGADGWPMTCSHEFVEMLADPWGNRLYRAPSPDPNARGPRGGRHYVSLLLELGDPCEDKQFGYMVNGMLMSDFILHSYGNGRVGPYDYCGYITKAREVLEGGYISWMEPDGTWKQLTNFGAVEVRVLGRPNTKPASIREWIDSHPQSVSHQLRWELTHG